MSIVTTTAARCGATTTAEPTSTTIMAITATAITLTTFVGIDRPSSKRTQAN